MTNVWLPMIPPTSPTPGGNVSAGALLALADCAAGAAEQQFALAADGSVKHAPSGLCVQAPASTGDQLTLAACDAAAPQQRWAPAHGGNTLTNDASGSCVSFNNDNQLLDVGNPVITWACGSPPAWNEQWTFSCEVGGAPGAIQALDESGSPSGRCVAVQSAQPTGWTIRWLDSWSLKDY